MPERLRISETVAQRTVETEITENVGIPSSLPAAERVVSVNARVEITTTEVGRDQVSFSGIIRASIYYAAADDPSNVVSLRRNFNFSDRISVPGARPGYEVTIESSIADIDFYVINERLLGVEFLVISDLEVTAPEQVQFIEERPDLELTRQRLRIRRELREREYTRELSSILSLTEEAEDINRVINVDSEVQIIDIFAGNNQVTVTGRVNNNILYLSGRGDVEYAGLDFTFEESFAFRGVTPEMTPFVEVNVLGEEARKVDLRRLRVNIETRFKILVIIEEEVSLPTGIVRPEGVFPISRTILVERVVAEERTRFLARGTVSIPDDNPDVARIIQATGRIRGGTLSAEASDGGVILSGTVDLNIVYVSSLPDQPVYFVSGSIPFNYFLDIAGVTDDMKVTAEVSAINTTASVVSPRQVNARVVLDASVVVTEEVRVRVVTGISETPVAPEEEEEGVITYTVTAGDTLFLIGQRFGVSVDRLIQINNITNPDRLEVGQQILIPVS